MNTIDARGLSCPEPVMLLKQAMSSGASSYEMKVDCKTAKENVTRYATSQGYKTDVKESDGEFTLTFTK
ncbi:TusA-related sulfurtransferase [Lachnospiraceae bacterium XBB1006]|nr:TusA-related sulfurtransferase [Lachnospiraceae bacterium XBB1006]